MDFGSMEEAPAWYDADRGNLTVLEQALAIRQEYGDIQGEARTAIAAARADERVNPAHLICRLDFAGASNTQRGVTDRA